MRHERTGANAFGYFPRSLWQTEPIGRVLAMRFSLRALMMLTLLAAVVCGAFFALPGIWSVMVLGAVVTVLPGALISGVCFGRGYARAFSIGCLAVAWAPALYHLYIVVMLAAEGSDFVDIAENMEEARALKIAYAVVFSLISLSGLLSVGVRWLIAPSGDPASSPAEPLRSPFRTDSQQRVDLARAKDDVM
jgi:hypothetical protein